jgi:hypothetical protein
MLILILVLFIAISVTFDWRINYAKRISITDRTVESKEYTAKAA